MNNKPEKRKSEFGFWFRDVKRASSFKGDKSVDAYLEGIERDALGLTKPQSALSKTKAHIMEPGQDPTAFEAVFADSARNNFS